MACTVVVTHYVCTGIIRLGGGDIYVAVGPTDETLPAAVTGGTRGYDGARGQFTQTENGDNTGSFSISLLR